MYSRFTALKNYSKEDQEKLKDSTAAVIGLGATGSAIAENLARHGINLIIIDRDYLEPNDIYSSNLYTPQQCEKALPKAVAAKEKLEKFTEVKAFTENLSTANMEILDEADIILDGTDNLETRQKINDYCKKEEVPWIYTAALAEKAYSMFFDQKCFKCMLDKQVGAATCETDGILREVAQRAAASSTRKAVKYLTGKKVEERLELVNEGRSLEVEHEGCEVCLGERFPHLEEEDRSITLCGGKKFQLEKDFSFEEMRNREETEAENKYLVKFIQNGYELVFFRSGRVIVEAKDEGHARSLISEAAGI